MSGTPSMRAGHTPADGGLRASALAADLERDASNGSSSESAVSTFESLQSTAGNRAVNSLLQPPGGEALPRGVREQMEERFRFDFSGVRVHTGPAAADAAAALRAKAYTVGRDIVFSDGRFAPETTTGTQLLAHELAHVVQQSRGGAAPALDRGAPHEVAARTTANAVVSESGPVNVAGASAVGIAREPEDDNGDGPDEEQEAPRSGIRVKGTGRKKAPDPRTQTDERGQGILGEFAERQRQARAAGPRVQLGEDRTTTRKESSEKARHRERGADVHGHHGFPKFLGGNKVQRYIKLTEELHTLYHEELYLLLDAELKKHGKLPEDAGRKSRKHYGRIFGRLDPKTRQEILDKIIEHAEGFDTRYRKADPTRNFEGYPDKRQRLTAALRRGIREAKAERQRRARARRGGAAAPPAGRGGRGRAAAAGPTPRARRGAAGRTSPTRRTAPAKGAPGPTTAGPSTGMPAGGSGPSKGAAKRAAPATKTAPVSTAADVDVEDVTETKDDAEPRRTPGQRRRTERGRSLTGAGTDTLPATKEEDEQERDEVGTKPRVSPRRGKRAAPQVRKDPTESDVQTPAPPPKKKSAASVVGDRKPADKPPAPTTPPQTKGPTAAKPPVQTKPPAQTKTPPVQTQPPATKQMPLPGPVKPRTQAKSPQAVPPSTPPVQKPPAQKPPAQKAVKTAPGPKPPSATKGQPSPGQQKTPPTGGPRGSSVSTTSGAWAGSPGTALTGPPGNIAASRSFGARAVQSHGKGVQTFQNIGANGRVAIETTELLNMTPTQYRTTVTITLGATAGGGVSKESQDPKGGVGGSLSAQASGSVTATFSHVLNAEETQKYLAAIKSGSGGAHKELQIIQLATANQVEEAKTLLAQQRGTGGLAHASKNLAEGDVVSLDTEGTVAGEAGISGSQGRAGVGVQVGAHQTDRVSHTVTRHGGKNYVTVTVASEKGKSLGGSVSYMGMGVGHTAHDAAGQTESMTFELDPNAADYEARLAAITAARTPDDLKKLAARQSAVSKTTGKDQTTGGTTQVSAGPIAFAGTESGTYAEEETTTPEGVSRTYTGSGTSATQLTAGQHTLAKTAKTDTITTTVGPDKKARGTTSSTNVETDWGTSIQRLASSMEDRPGATAAGLGSGETKLLQEKVDTKGKHLSDDSYARLAELAKDPAAWQKAWSGNVQTFIDWEALRKRVLAANGDREQIAKAMAEFGSKGSGRSTTVEAAVAGTGVAFEFPQSVAQQKPVYDTFVAGDALAHPRELAAAGQVNEALAELNDIKAKLTTLSREIEMHNGDFSEPAKLAEMMGRISTRSAEIRAEIRKLSAPPSPQAAVGAEAAAPTPGKKLSPVEKAAADKKTAEQAEETRKQQELAAKREEDKAKREERNAKIDLLVPQCLTLQEKERSVFAKVNAEFDSWFKSVATIFNDLNSVKSSWPHWDSLIEQLRAVYQERGDSPDRASQFAPNKGEWNRLNSRALQ